MPLESRIGPRLYTTSLRLHQPRLIPSLWRGGTTSRLPLPAHNAGDSSRPPDEGDAGRLSISTRTAFFLLPRGISFQLTCFTLLVTGRNPFGGTLCNNGDPPDHTGASCVGTEAGPVGPLALCWGPFHCWGQRSVYEVGATQRNGSITCFSRQEGWTYFCPKRKKCETRHWMPGPVRIGSDSLTTV